MPPIIAPSKSSPIWEIAKINPPKPAITPISGMPVKLDANKKRATPNIIQGKNTAIRAEPTPPAFFPPTMPAISGPAKGNQNRRSDITNIQIIALRMLPFFSSANFIPLFLQIQTV